jgi:hypothetical protein
MQLWNGDGTSSSSRPAVNSMLFKFQIELAARKLAHKSKRNEGK